MQSALQLSDTELQMMDEVFEVFAKYGHATRKFAVQLEHSHFPISNDEVLYETHDTERRTLMVEPVKLQEMSIVPLATAWSRSDKGNFVVSMFCCDHGGNGGKS